MGWMSVVECEVSYLSKFMKSRTLRMPMDLPATLTKPAPSGTSRYMRMGYQCRGKMGSCSHFWAVLQKYSHGH